MTLKYNCINSYIGEIRVMKVYFYYLLYTSLFPILFILSLLVFAKSVLFSVLLLALGIYFLFHHIKMSRKLFFSKKRIIPSYETLYDMDVTCWACDFFKRCYNNDFPPMVTPVNTAVVVQPKAEERQWDGKRSLLTSEIDRNSLKIRIREYAFDSYYEKNVYLALVRHLHKEHSISFHVHLNEVFNIVNGDISYYNPLWTYSFDFVLRESTRLDNLIAVVDVEYAINNYNDARTMDINNWKQKLCEENKIPYLRLSRAEALQVKPYDESSYPASLYMFIHHFKD